MGSWVNSVKFCSLGLRVVATEWPQFRDLAPRDLIDQMKTPVVLDANRFLEKTLGGANALTYIAVGMPKESA